MSEPSSDRTPDRTTERTVLVVGGGPVGLVTACELRLRGIDVRVVDRTIGLTPHSRAIVVWPRSLELLRRIGVSRRLLSEGHRVERISYYSDFRRLGAIDLAALDTTPYPYGVTIPQVQTERVLRERLAELGGTVERGVELTALRYDGGRPTATLRHHDGRVEDVTSEWLVGADGARSTVRELLRIPFPAYGNEVLFAIGDGHLDGGMPQQEMVYSYTPAGSLGIAPLGNEVFRVAFSVPSWDGEEPPGVELFQQMLDALSPRSTRMSGMRWSTVFRARRRLAATFRAGRCFLAGDAAHVFSAAGAQGMNTGIQDGVNLGWRLAGVVTGELDESVLDRYGEERRPHAERVSLNTQRQTEWGLIRGRARTAVRDVAVAGAARTGLLQRVGAPLMSQTDSSYRELYGEGRASRIDGTRLHLGDRVPAFAAEAGRPADGWPVLATAAHSLLTWAGGAPDARWADRVEALRDRLAGRVAVTDASGQPALRRLCGRRPLALLVRPDGHVAACAPDLDDASVDAMLARAGVTGAAAGLRPVPAPQAYERVLA